MADVSVSQLLTAQDVERIRESIVDHDQKFQELLCLIPSKYYIPQSQLTDSGPLGRGRSSASGNKSKAQKSQKLDRKRAQLMEEARRLQKRKKFDPDSFPTIPELQGLKRSAPLSPLKNPLENPKEEKVDESLGGSKIQLSRDELQARLKSKIEQLQQNPTRKDIIAESDRPTSKDELLEQGRKKRGEMRDRRRRERKEVRRKEKLLKEATLLAAKKKKTAILSKNKKMKGSSSTQGQSKTPLLNESGTTQSDTKDGDGTSRLTTTSSLSSPDAKPASSPSSPSQTAKSREASEPDLAYSALSFEVGSSLPGESSVQRNRNPTWTSKDPKRAKEAMDRRQSYLSKLTPQQRERAEEAKRWEKASLQASGVKVMDDVKKLEKSIKRQSKESSKRKSQWEERTRMVEQSQANQQKKREENILKRKQQNQERKLGKRSSNHKSHPEVRRSHKGTVKARGNTQGPKRSIKGF